MHSEPSIPARQVYDLLLDSVRRLGVLSRNQGQVFGAATPQQIRRPTERQGECKRRSGCPLRTFQVRHRTSVSNRKERVRTHATHPLGRSRDARGTATVCLNAAKLNPQVSCGLLTFLSLPTLMCRICRWVRLNPASSRGRRFSIDPCLRAQLSPRPSTPQPHDRNFERDLYQPLHHGMCRRCNHPNRGRNRRSRRLRPQGGRPNAGFAPLRPHGAQLPVNRCAASLPSLAHALPRRARGSRRRCSPSRSPTWSA